jgi:hypothetical protein
MTPEIKEKVGDPWQKIREMVLLLIECRDALPAITLTSAQLRGIDLRLADKIEDCLEPWEITEQTLKELGVE